MLQALGITHVVSVGECALVPPDSHNARGHGSSGNNSQGSGHFIPSKSSAHQGSLWIEERAGRIKVLDIQGVCDDGIDTLEPQLEPICDWIDQARQEGGQVLVHCRVGVSRSATVTVSLFLFGVYSTVLTVIIRFIDRICHETSLSSSCRRVLNRSFPASLGSHSAEHASSLQPSRLGDQASKRPCGK